MRCVTVPADENDSRLDHFLGRLLPKAPKGFIYRMLRKKNITRNGKKAEGSDRVRCGDVIALYLSDGTIEGFSADAETRDIRAENLAVLYEDADALIVSKEAGILVQGDRTNAGSLTDLVRAYLKERDGAAAEGAGAFPTGGAVSAKGDAPPYKASPANRIDRNTSGIVLFGKTLTGAKALTEALREREAVKTYIACAEGCALPDGVYSAYLRKDEKTNTVTVTEDAKDSAEPIRTGVRTIRENGPESLLCITLYTGRPHQIRAHLAFLGHPVVGDPKYGRRAGTGAAKGIRRQMLHAYAISFPEDMPLCGLRGKTVTAPLPEDMRNFIASRFGEDAPEEVRKAAGEQKE